MANTTKPLTFGIRANLFTHLAAMEKAGLPVDKAFELLRLPAPADARLEATRRLLAQGMDPAVAGERSGLFTGVEMRFVRAALTAGNGAAMYRRLAETYVEKTKQAKLIRSRMAMPIVVLMVSLFVSPLPALVAGTLTVGGYLFQGLWPLLALAALFQLLRTLPERIARGPDTPTRFWIENAMLRFPLFGPMYLRRNVRDFVECLGLMLEAGVPMFDALQEAVGTIGNTIVRKEFAGIKPEMVQGATLAQAVAGLRYVGNRELLGYVQTGEGSGSLPEMLLRHANAESEAVYHFQQLAAEWLPRLFYGLVALRVAYGILTSGAFMPHVPDDV